ncbi:MAG: 30S ribosomal protein S8 [Candidatus Infernicultor aquiphilus]|uniref:Small ribosomal subunit protein uS8 n=1 Tax=Candidatus Infernicultor aquiphilus TaxID=1805029 RepID=A0A1J5H409_9BACT|nr:30S ribosomal protein S8 [bacterium]OIP74806.1 MAG: 30S ribosomal protein S8 [Candidatus Atribacteria bacterium CG2_30_33_13]PIU25704.1 MAG: 30S ribosomal protein S8 [Candidatus Atribacteria bacterium CG08_land_8_20_14_0_20_33_29]PIW12664.1 MAG: 30S ribosomal protein S8 [Candidatus Atribacteria bacterium CG17_big_fil_post_rev_8_21_14_2_50_34_11]PIX33465.1 MAG: 30S ribosomal protein S8 [Candidatus Atribacteria bacterium CG_4_8_14_3_um_filter_34_18]PIY32394.1 MAG: 30S ribosomal protein S8 [Ca
MSVVSDPIADMLTRIRNANKMRHNSLTIPASKLKLEITRVLKDEGFIRNYKYKEDNKQGQLIIYLKYINKEKTINNLKRISKPGLKVYAKKDEIPRVLGGLGIVILSTSRGIMTGKEALQRHLGGEVICYIW